MLDDSAVPSSVVSPRHRHFDGIPIGDSFYSNNKGVDSYPGFKGRVMMNASCSIAVHDIFS